MNKSRVIFLAFILIFIIGIPRAWTIEARANHSEIVSSDDKEQIITTVKAYFEQRYRSHSTLQLEDFKGLVDETPKGDNFLSAESEKLEIELDHAKKYHLRYLEYEFFSGFRRHLR